MLKSLSEEQKESGIKDPLRLTLLLRTFLERGKQTGLSSPENKPRIYQNILSQAKESLNQTLEGLKVLMNVWLFKCSLKQILTNLTKPELSIKAK